MIKNVIGGICVGMANIIPGVSGGTIMVLLGLFDKTVESISNMFSLKTSFKIKIDSFLFLLQVLIGAAIGLVVFANVLEFLFNKIPNQTLYLFSGLILFSLPFLKKKELSNEKINFIYFILGILVIGLLVYFNPGEKDLVIELSELLSKNLDINFILTLLMLGFISGATMIFPGVSGSMVLLVLGYYYLFQAYIANVTSFELLVILPILIIGIGAGLGIIISSILTNYLLKNHKTNTMSLILGLVIASGFAIIPTAGYDLITTLTSILSFLIGGLIIYLFEKRAN